MAHQGVALVGYDGWCHAHFGNHIKGGGVGDLGAWPRCVCVCFLMKSRLDVDENDGIDIA